MNDARPDFDEDEDEEEAGEPPAIQPSDVLPLALLLVCAVSLFGRL